MYPPCMVASFCPEWNKCSLIYLKSPAQNHKKLTGSSEFVNLIVRV